MQKPKYIITLQGNLVKWSIKNFAKNSNSSNSTKSKRNKIKSFSDRSHKRLLEELLTLKFFIAFPTLTYPKNFPTDPKKFKRDLDVFGKRLLWKFPRCYFLWKLEFQKRGAPHYHLLGTFGDVMRSENGKLVKIDYNDPKTRRYIQKWISKAWFEVVGSNDINHFKAGTRVDFILDSPQKAIKKYLAKYTAKPDSTENEIQYPGRFWGRIGKQNEHLVKYPKIEIEVDKHTYHNIRRIFRKFIKSLGKFKLFKAMKKYPCFTVYISPKPAFKLIINAIKIAYEKLKDKELELRGKIISGEISEPYKVAFTLEDADELSKLAKQIPQKLEEIKTIANGYLKLFDQDTLDVDVVIEENTIEELEDIPESVFA